MCEACGLRGADAFLHLGEIAPAGDLLELGGIERIDRDIDPPHPMAGKFSGIFRKLAAIGGERQFFKRARFEMAREAFDQRHDALAHQRLAAGQPQLLDALLNENRADPVQLLDGQQVLLRQECHVFGHAIDTAEIAAVGHRHAEIGNAAPKRIDKAALAGSGDGGLEHLIHVTVFLNSRSKEMRPGC